MNWSDIFNAIVAAMAQAAGERSADAAISEAERHGLIKQGDGGTYQDKIWDKTDEGTTLRFRWHCYDQSHAYRILPDMNVLSLELRQGDRISRRAEQRYED